MMWGQVFRAMFASAPSDAIDRTRIAAGPTVSEFRKFLLFISAPSKTSDVHYTYDGPDPGNLRSRVLQIKNPDPQRTPPVKLVWTERIQEAQIDLPAGTELLDLTSPLLSKFWGRPIHIPKL